MRAVWIAFIAGAGCSAGSAPEQLGPQEAACSFGPHQGELGVTSTLTRALYGLATISLRDDGSRLRFDHGEDIALGRPSLPVADGDRVYANLRTKDNFFWKEAFLVLREPSVVGGGDLLAAIWEGSWKIELREMTVDFETDDCAPIDLEQPFECGLVTTRSLRVIESGRVTRIGAGDSTNIGSYRIVNGRSYIYPNEPLCTDTPREWGSGSIVLRD